MSSQELENQLRNCLFPTGVPAGLSRNILAAVKRQERQRARRQFLAATGGLLGSVWLLWQSWVLASSRLAKTGTGQILSLLGSDFHYVVLYWKNFSLSILESLPVLEIIFVLAAVLAVVYFLRNLVRGVRHLRPQPFLSK